jgi:hypothetical protein
MFAVITAAYGQGVYWESKTDGTMMQGKSAEAKFYYMPGKFKTVTSRNGDAVIVRLDKEFVITVNAEEKTYSEITFAELEEVMKKSRARMDSHMEEVQKQMADLPEEQRKMMEKMMEKLPGKQKEGKVSVRKTGGQRSISGFSCTQYVVSQDGKDVVTVWATKEVHDFKTMRKDLEEFSRRMAALSPMGSVGLVEGMKTIDGFPIQTEAGDGVTLVTKIERRSTPAAEFEAPAGYAKVASPMIEGGYGEE